MARRNSTRKASRKNRRNNVNAANAGPANAAPLNAPAAPPNAPNAGPANAAPAMRKSRKQSGGKRKLSPALREWNKKVMEVYREMKKKNPNTRLMDAMKEAKKRS
jgi:hypothetical protein